MQEEKLSEILKRFEKKISEPRSDIDGKKISKIIKEYLKISCKLENAKTILKNLKINMNKFKDK